MRLTIAIVSLALFSSLAFAQRPLVPLGGEPPTLGVHLDAPSLVDGWDASGIEVNPATMALLNSWAVLFEHAELREEGRVPGAGDALLAATPLPLLRSIALGAGLQWLRPPEAIGYAESVKLSLGLAWRYQQLFALGLAYHTFFADKDPALDGLDALDLGFALRPFEWLGFGAVVYNLNTPVYDGFPLQRVYAVELAGRPLATDRLELAAGLRIGERRGDVDPYLRLEGEPLAGLRLFSEVNLLQRDFAREGEELLDVRATVGLRFNLERVGLSAGAIVGRELPAAPAGPLARADARSPYQGFEVALRLQGERRLPLFQLRRKLLYVPLKGSLSQRAWVQLAATLWRAEQRADLEGIALDVDGLESGWGQVQELRGVLQRLRRAGKATYVYLHAPSGREYYLAAAADRVLLDPAGAVQLKGLTVESLHFKGLFDRVGVSPQFVRIGEYKSAPEAFTETTATPAARRMQQSLLEDLFAQVVRDLAKDRKKSASEMERIVNEGPFTPPRARERGLVDLLVGPDEIESKLGELSGATLIQLGEQERRPARWPVGPAIAVVLVEGDIVRGKSVQVPVLDRSLVGDDTLADALTWARAAPEVKAVVVRVDSGGGSAMASEAMWREVVRTRKVKPVVVSFGDVAASGGYFVGAAGERIFAEPATVTGSIGIFTGKFDVSGLLAKLGISADTYARGQRALLDSFKRPYTAEERAFVLSQLTYYYHNFLKAVADGRRMTMDEADRLGRGRVWTGQQALARGLVDAPGGLLEAIEEAKRRAGLGTARPVRLHVLPEEQQGLLARVIPALVRAPEMPAWSLPPALRQALLGVPPVLLRAAPNEPLARLPYQIVFP